MPSAELTPPMTRRNFLAALLGSAIYLSTTPIHALGEQLVSSRQTPRLPLRVLTLNVWGIPIASDRAERMKAIGEQITLLDPDVAPRPDVNLASAAAAAPAVVAMVVAIGPAVHLVGNVDRLGGRPNAAR